MAVYLVSLQQLMCARVRRAGHEACGPERAGAQHSGTQLGGLPSECNEPGKKVLLTLLYRLAAIEAQLADLGVQARGISPPSPGLSDVHDAHMEVGDAGKSGLLEQVFRNNLLLRRMD